MSYAAQLIPDHPTGMKRWAPVVVAMVMPALAAIAFAWPTLDAGFQMGDDQRFVTENSLVQRPSWPHAWEIVTNTHGDLYQPIPLLSFQATNGLASPDSSAEPAAFPHHLCNLLLHALNSALAAFVALRLSKRTFLGLLTGVLFATHPLALEAVAWVSGRMMLLASSFSLLLLALATRRQDQPGGAWHAGAVVTWLLACASKVIPTIPIVAFVFERATQTTARRSNKLLYGLLFLIGLAATALMARQTSAVEFTFNRGQSAKHMLGTVLLAFGRYLENYIWPVNLAPWTPPLDHVDWVSPRMFLSVMSLFAILVCAWSLRRRLPVAAAGLVMFILVLLPFLAAGLTRRLFVADRYMYLPILGLHVFVVVMVNEVAAMCAGRARLMARRIIAGIPIFLLCGFWLNTAYALAPSWQSPVQFARRIVEVHPDSVMAANELARAHIHQERPNEALKIIEKARERWPDEPRLAAQAGRAFAMTGALDRAQEELSRALETMPLQAAVRYEYALVLDRQGASTAAVGELRMILDSHPTFLPVYRALALVYRKQGQHEAEAAMLEAAVQQNRFHRDNLFDLANIYFRSGRTDAAESLFRRVLALYPSDEPSLLNLGVILAQTGRVVDAIKCYDRILAQSPRTTTALLNRAALLKQINQTLAAEADARQALTIEPQNREAIVMLHELLISQQAWQKLATFWQDIDTDAEIPQSCMIEWAKNIDAIVQQEPRPPVRDNNKTTCHLLLRIYTSLATHEQSAMVNAMENYIALLEEDGGLVALSDPRLIFPLFETLPVETRNKPSGLLALAILLDATDQSSQATRVLQSINRETLAADLRRLFERYQAARRNVEK